MIPYAPYFNRFAITYLEDPNFNQLAFSEKVMSTFYDKVSAQIKNNELMPIEKLLCFSNESRLSDGTREEIGLRALEIQNVYENVLLDMLKENPLYKLRMYSVAPEPIKPLCAVSPQVVIQAINDSETGDGQTGVTERIKTLYRLLSYEKQFQYVVMFNKEREGDEKKNFSHVIDRYPNLLAFPTEINNVTGSSTGVSYYLTNNNNETHVFTIRNASLHSSNGDLKFYHGNSNSPLIKKIQAPLDTLISDLPLLFKEH